MLTARLLAALIALSVAPLAARAAPGAPAQPSIGAGMRAKIDGDVEASLRATHTEAATVAIVAGGRVVYARGFGLRDVAGALPADAGTQYEIGSITKQFTATAILQLKESGKIDLDAPLATYLPRAPHAADVTIRQLLTQTSGLPEYMSVPNIETAVVKPATFDQLIAPIADKPLEFKPGTQWEYSSTNYLLLGRVVEVLSGQTWDEYLKEHIFVPAGMTNSATIAGEASLSNMARGYVYANGKAGPSVPVDDSWAGAAGGIASTVGDLAAFHAALPGKLISMDDYRLMTTQAKFTDGSSSQYGFGLYIDTYDDQPRVWHNGNTFGFDASDQSFTNQGVRIIVLTNSLDGGSDELVANIFNDLYPAIASGALNGANGAAPGLAVKFQTNAQAISTDMAPVDIYRRALATMRSVEAPAYLQFKQQSNTTFSGHTIPVIQHLVHLERTADRTYKIRDVDVDVAHNVTAAVFPPDLFLAHASSATPSPDSNSFPIGLDDVDPKPLKTIATTIAKSAYKVTLVGADYLPGCGSAIHLKLEPLRDPVRYNVRGLWIDPNTSRICKANAVWQGQINGKKVYGEVTLSLNADGLIDRYSFSATARFVVASISAHQDGFLTDIRSVSQLVWAAAPDH
jgi:D-alanyl-D-alanine carboxypeptidase